jgi:hypothetical protein
VNIGGLDRNSTLGMKTLLALAGLGMVAAGCHPMEPATAPVGDPGDLEVVVENHLGWPYRVTEVVVALDGALLYRRRGEPGPRTRAARLPRLPPGDHTVLLLARVGYSSGSVSDACELTLRGSQTFSLGPRAARVTLDLYASGPNESFTDRVRLDVRREGTFATSEVATAPPPPEARCGTPDGSIDQLVCRARARLDDAERLRDVIRFQCYRDKWATLSRLAREDERAVLEPTSPAERDLKRRVARERARVVWQELEQCVGESQAFTGLGEPSSDTPSCRGDELLPDPNDSSFSRR